VDSVAPGGRVAYFFDMGRWSLLLVLPAAATIAIGVAAAADRDQVPLYTNDDLDRMFGPAPAQPSDPVDKTRPEDWRWVEQFLDRQYSRIDADRQYDLGRRSVDIAANAVEGTSPFYGRAWGWGLGYPASTWWGRVGASYASWGNNTFRGSNRGYAWATGGSRERNHSGGHSGSYSGGHSGGHGSRPK
jgi:hypothetical protein